MPKAVNPGDVFLAKLSDGRYKAVRVLRKVGKSSLVYTSEYLGNARPNLDEPLLQRTVVQNRFFFRREPARHWLDGNPPPSFELLGNVPLSEDEAAIKCNVYAGMWDDNTGNEAFMEWRWLHDRPAFEEEIRKQNEDRERRRRLPQKPKKMMSEDEFWSIISILDWEQQGNDELVLAPAIKALASKSKATICRFEERFAFLMYQIDTKAHANNNGDDSADGFVYARCAVIANGREFYEAVLRDPTKMPKDIEFESLLGLASGAYELKTGNEFEYTTGCSYESFSNPAGWRDESITNG